MVAGLETLRGRVARHLYWVPVRERKDSFMLVKKISRAAAVLALALVCGRASAEAPQLPAKAVGDDTWLVVHVNAAKLDPDSIDQSLQAILGPQAAMAQQAMSDFRTKYKEIVDAGAQSMTIVASGPVGDGKEPNGVGYIKLKPGTDHAAVEKKIRDEQAKSGTKDADNTEFLNDGDYLIVHKKGTPMPAGGASDRTKLFTDALGSSEKSLVFAFVPTPDIRTKMKESAKGNNDAPDWAKNLGPQLSDAKWMSVDVNLGAAPTIGVTAQAADDASAKSIADSVTQGQQQLQTMADQMKQNPQGAAFAGALGALADALKPTQAGSKVSLTIDGAKVGPAVQTMIPMLLMGRQGGGVAPPPPSKSPSGL
jgi:hypothetical protein